MPEVELEWAENRLVIYGSGRRASNSNSQAFNPTDELSYALPSNALYCSGGILSVCGLEWQASHPERKP